MKFRNTNQQLQLNRNDYDTTHNTVTTKLTTRRYTTLHYPPLQRQAREHIHNQTLAFAFVALKKDRLSCLSNHQRRCLTNHQRQRMMSLICTITNHWNQNQQQHQTTTHDNSALLHIKQQTQPQAIVVVYT